MDFDTVLPWKISGDGLLNSSEKDIQTTGNAKFTVYDSIQINVARVSIMSYSKDKRIWASVKNN